MRSSLLWAFALLLASASAAQAQRVPKKEYLRYVPLEEPRLIRQTAASEALALYGDRSDPDYADLDPLDGIDDRRGRVFQQLALRFAPYMVLNTTSVPLAPESLFRDQGSFPMYIDTWNTSVGGGEFIGEETVDMLTVVSNPCTQFERLAGNSRKADCRLLELLEEYNPYEPSSALARTAAKDPDFVPFKVMYFDLPGGYGPEEWNQTYQDQQRRLPQKFREGVNTFVHPFLVEKHDRFGAPSGYEFLLQYWFFYPTNDGGNNHVGDWEHINVVVSPLGKLSRDLSAAEVGELLDGRGLNATSGDEQLVIKRIDYYFHSKVFPLDFSAPNAYLPREQWEAELEQMEFTRDRIEQDWFWRKIRHRAFKDEAETEINTHPIAFIGADNKGLDQLLSMPGGTNRDSHGTFPFTGLYKDIGPAGAAENVGVAFDHREFFESSPEEQRKRLAEFNRGGVVSLADEERIQILPDWEVLYDLIRTDIQVRQQWSWLVLPVRFGYPAVESPFAGVVSHAETGNLSILGPAFNSGWNKAGASGQYALYKPNRFPRMFPLSWQDGFMNSWGFLNLTLPTLIMLPPIDFLWRIVAAPVRSVAGRNDPTFYPTETVPFRFFGFSSGVARAEIGDEYVDLLVNDQQFPEILVDLALWILVFGDSTTQITSFNEVTEDAAVPYFQGTFYIGKRFVTSSTLRHSRTDIGFGYTFTNAPPFNVAGELNFWEYAGSLRYSLATSALQPYLLGGYGLSWYRIENTVLTGNPDDPDQRLPMENSESPWVRKPSFFPFKNLLPNTWHVGAGFEFMVIKSFGAPPRGIDFTVSGEWRYYTNNTGVDVGALPLDFLAGLGLTADQLPRSERSYRNVFRLGATIGF